MVRWEENEGLCFATLGADASLYTDAAAHPKRAFFHENPSRLGRDTLANRDPDKLATV